MNMDWFSFVSAIITAFFGQRLTADNEAIVLCRQDLLELEKILKYINEHKNKDGLSLYKKEFIENLKKFEMHHINLLIQYSDVQNIIKKSDEILNKPVLEIDQRNFWVGDLLKHWHCLTESNDWNEDNNIVIWRNHFFYQGFFLRLGRRILSCKISLPFCIVVLLLLFFFLYGVSGKGEQWTKLNYIVLISY